MNLLYLMVFSFPVVAAVSVSAVHVLVRVLVEVL